MMSARQHIVFDQRTAFVRASRVGLGLLVSSLFVVSGCEEKPAGSTELAAIAAMQRVHAHVETDAKGYAVKLVLVRSDIRADDLIPLEQLKHLQFLSLEKSSVTDAGLAHLSDLTNLKQLSLRDTNITDLGLKHLKGLSSLTELDLEKTKITNAGLEHLTGITSLRKLYVGPGGPTASGIDALKAGNPRVSVIRK